MKISNIDNYVHMLDNLTNPWAIIREIADSNERRDAFYVCDVGDIIRKIEMWKRALPRVEPYYSVKCNDSMTVLEILAALGTGFDCRSNGEIDCITSIGVPSDRIIFSNPIKPLSLLKNASNIGISFLTFDSIQELQKIKKYQPEVNLVIKVRLDDVDDYSGIKFGCEPSVEAPNLLNTARSLGLKVIGVSFQHDSPVATPQDFSKFIQIAKELFDYASTLDYNFDVLDLGGGFPGQQNDLFEQIIDAINDALDVHFTEISVRIMAEPSRFLVSSAFTLACNIHSIRVVDKTDPLTGDYHTHRMYFINDGVYGSFNFLLHDQQQLIEPQPLKDDQMAKMYSSSIWGPTCDGMDQIIDEAVLQEMNTGDWIVFEDMGAYTVPSNSNGFPVAKVHVMVDENTWNFLKENLMLTEDHFIMGRAEEKSMKKKNLKENITLPSIIPRHQLSGTITFDDDNIFHSIHFQWE